MNFTKKQSQMKIKPTRIIILALGILFFPVFVFASSTNGTIDSTYKYAWGENIGWINFGAANGDIHVTDSSLSGYALSETIGWINLGNVTNDNEGNLAGYGWSENAGWINFAPTNGGVVINSSGEFTGQALGENIGWIIFGGDYKVKTDWQPRSIRPQCNNSTDDDSDGKTDYPDDDDCSSLTDNNETSEGGGGLPVAAYNPPSTPAPSAENPAGGFRVVASNGAAKTSSRTITLKLYADSNIKRMAISEDPDFKLASQETFEPTKIFTLSEGEGQKTVYVKFFTEYGQASKVVSCVITYEKPLPVTVSPESAAPVVENKPSETAKVEVEPAKLVVAPKKPLVSRLPKAIQSLVPDFLKPKAPEPPAPVPLEETLAKEAPQAMKGDWSLLPKEPLNELVFKPLPQEVLDLAEKFPHLSQTFADLGINKFSDLEKIQTAKFALPSLTKLLDLAKITPHSGQFTALKNMPLAKLPVSIKAAIPTEVVFAKTAGEAIDLEIDLSISEKGETSQKISTVANQPINLIVKPQAPARSVRGYLVLKNPNLGFDAGSFVARNSQEAKGFSQNSDLKLNDLLASVTFAKPVLASSASPSQYLALEGAKIKIPQVLGVSTESLPTETRLALLEFEYTDADGDGIYTADIKTPASSGEYEVITIIDYEDIKLGAKEIRLITVVDPEGYVYEKLGEKEVRVPGAIVSIYYLNSQTKKYELWSATEFQQENPQITDKTGRYSFLVPEGDYYLKIEAPGYQDYEGKPFLVKQGTGIHTNVELQAKNSWFKKIDWKVTLLIVVVLLLLYNFYRDKLRERIKK